MSCRVAGLSVDKFGDSVIALRSIPAFVLFSKQKPE
jgi:hypothetical protein